MAGSTDSTGEHGSVKNVIIVDDAATDIGGTAQVACTTARILVDRGYNVVYFAGTGPICDRLSGIRVVIVQEEPFLECASKMKGALEGLSSKRAYRALCSLLLSFDPANTVLHVHSWTHALSSSIFDAIADMGFRSLITLHDYFLTCPNGGFYDYRRREICHLRPCSPACVVRNCDKRSYAQKIYRVVRLSLQTRALKRAKPQMAYLSEFTYNILRGNRFDNGDTLYLPNPIEAQGRLCPSPIDSRRGYLFVGRMDYEKNPELFCEALTVTGLPGTLCGDGPLLSELKRKYPNLTFLGWCDREELTRAAQASKALVLTSRWLEASPLVCVEAMLSACIPSIVPNTCGAIAYIEDGKNGIHFESGNLESLCSAIRSLENERVYDGICDYIEKHLPNLFEERCVERYAERVAEIYESLRG